MSERWEQRGSRALVVSTIDRLFHKKRADPNPIFRTYGADRHFYTGRQHVTTSTTTPFIFRREIDSFSQDGPQLIALSGETSSGAQNQSKMEENAHEFDRQGAA